MTFQTMQVGKKGEEIAVQFLLEQKYSILECNFHTRFAEIDIIAKKNEIIYFIEVKTRTGIEKGKPYEAVNKRKLFHLTQASELYVLKNKLRNYKLSMMVISIVVTKELKVESINSYIVEY